MLKLINYINIMNEDPIWDEMPTEVKRDQGGKCSWQVCVTRGDGRCEILLFETFNALKSRENSMCMFV